MATVLWREIHAQGFAHSVSNVQRFVAELRREGERLEAWLDKADTSDIEELKRFAGRLRADRDAVQAGLTLRHSNGQTEGYVNRLKLIKRQGYGRAKVDLLRKRLLRAA